MTIRDRIPVVIGALIAVICQIVLAPNMHIFYAVPNFVLAYVIAISVANVSGSNNYFTAFVLGLVYDLISFGAVGSMAFVCVAIMLIASAAFRAFDNETHFIPVLVIIVSCFIGELGYGLLMIACGIDVSLLDTFVYQVLPCTLYDIVVAIIAYLLALRFAFKVRQTSEMKIIDSSVD